MHIKSISFSIVLCLILTSAAPLDQNTMAGALVAIDGGAHSNLNMLNAGLGGSIKGEVPDTSIGVAPVQYQADLHGIIKADAPLVIAVDNIAMMRVQQQQQEEEDLENDNVDVILDTRVDIPVEDIAKYEENLNSMLDSIVAYQSASVVYPTEEENSTMKQYIAELREMLESVIATRSSRLSKQAVDVRKIQ